MGNQGGISLNKTTMEKKTKNMNIEDIKTFIKNRALRCAGSCNSQSTLEFNVLNELYSDLFGEPAVNTIPSYDFSSPTKK